MNRVNHTITCWTWRYATADFDACWCSVDTPLVDLGGRCVKCEELPPCDCPLGFDVSDAASSSS